MTQAQPKKAAPLRFAEGRNFKPIKTRNEIMMDIIQHELEEYYYMLAVSVGEWVGLPEQKMEIPSRQIERLLYYNGTCTIFKEPASELFFVLPVAELSIQENAYGEPSAWQAQAQGVLAAPISRVRLTPENAVLIRNNDAYRSSAPYVNEMIRQMVNIEFTKRLNINAQKVSFQFKGNRAEIINAKAEFEKLMECEPIIYRDTRMDCDLEPIQWGVPLIAAELDDAYNAYEQRINEYLGLDCVVKDKAERLTAEEASSNDQKIKAIRADRTRQRKLAAEKARKLWPELSGFDYIESAEVLEEGDGYDEGMAGPTDTGDNEAV